MSPRGLCPADVAGLCAPGEQVLDGVGGAGRVSGSPPARRVAGRYRLMPGYGVRLWGAR